MLTSIDLYILTYFQKKIRCRWLDYLVPKISACGNYGIIWIAASLILLMTDRYRDLGTLIIIGLALGFLIGNVILKNLFARLRPCWLINTELLIKMPNDYSFPSCHTLSSVIATLFLINAGLIIGTLAVIVAIAIAFSRLYLFVHYPTDILGGIIIGILIFYVLTKIILYHKALVF